MALRNRVADIHNQAPFVQFWLNMHIHVHDAWLLLRYCLFDFTRHHIHPCDGRVHKCIGQQPAPKASAGKPLAFLCHQDDIHRLLYALLAVRHHNSSCRPVDLKRKLHAASQIIPVFHFYSLHPRHVIPSLSAFPRATASRCSHSLRAMSPPH